MSLHRDLLEQARHLAVRDRSRPRQANLRRAISTAYYALFHLLVDEATRALIADPALRPLVGRAFDHGDMKNASQVFFEATRLPTDVAELAGSVIPPDLRLVAGCFVRLQGERHAADYKTDRVFTRDEAIDLVRQVEEAFEAWGRIRKQPIARVYLVSMMLWRRRR